MKRIKSFRSLGGVLTAAVLCLFFILTLVAPSNADTYVPISGTGSTWSQNALDQWRKNVSSNYGITINYSGTGSSAGRRDYISGTVDFAVSEIPFQSKPEDGSAPEVPLTKFAYMPIVAGGTSFMYNLTVKGQRVNNLRLSGEVITKIFTGQITNWSDPQIKADNPGIDLPSKTIIPVVRSDGSGTTAQFSLWMSKQYPSLWNAFCKKQGRPTPCGLTSQYPIFSGAKGQLGSNGVAGYVSQAYADGAITYVEYSYALKSGFPVAKVLNSAGYYVEPTAKSVAVALLKAKINNDPKSPDYLTQILDGVYNNPDPRTYPISSYSYMIVPTQTSNIFTTAKGKTLGAFAHYMLCEGQKQADVLGYSPLPMNLVQAGFEQIARIPGANDAANVNLSACDNPTFKAGDSLADNALAKTAPQPAACDKKGPTQCSTAVSTTTGGGTSTSTSNSQSSTSSNSDGSQGSASSSGDTSSSSSAGGGQGTGSTSQSGSTSTDPNSSTGTGSADNYGGVAASSSNQNVEAYVVKLKPQVFGTSQLILTLSGILLLLCIFVPAFVAKALSKNK